MHRHMGLCALDQRLAEDDADADDEDEDDYDDYADFDDYTFVLNG